MSKRWIKTGLTDQTIDIFVLDSSSTTGAGLTGLTSGTSGLTCYYRKGATGSAQQLTLASQTVGGAHADGGFVAIDGTNMPGLYRLDLSDTMVAAEGMLTIYLRGATNMAPVVAELEIVDVDIYDSVRLGLTALPNVASGSAGAIITSGTGTAQLNTASGNVTVGTNNDKTGYSLATAPPTSAEIADAVWDEALSGHLSSGSTGAALNAAGAAGDPWSTSIPGAYGAGTAGYILGTNIDATISSRLASGNVTVGGFASGAITSTAFGTGALTSNAFAAGAIAPGVLAATSITNTTFTNGAITAAVIATGAITADEISSNAAQEIANAVWSANINNDYAISPTPSAAWANDTMGKRVLRSSNNTDATEALVADAVWDEDNRDHLLAHSTGKNLDQIRKANYLTDGTVNSTTGASTTSFRTTLTEPNDTFDHQTILFVTGDLAGESKPILSYAQTNGVITLDEPLTAVPALNDEFVILPTHVHPLSVMVSQIADGVWDETLANHLTAGSTGAALDGAGGGGSTTTFVTGNLPYRVKSDEQFPGGVVDINIGTLMRLDLQIVDRDDNPINLTGGTVTVGVRNASTGATVGTDQSATLSLARLGYIYVDTVADWSATAGTYRITVSATLGSDVIVAGPLQLIVRTR
jgi:hypothetical protein